jgi:hypothetical protein
MRNQPMFTHTRTNYTHDSAARKLSGLAHPPAGHAAHDCCPGKSLKLPAGHRRRTPAAQYSPGAHTAEPVRVAAEALSSGLEYQPAGTAAGVPDAVGQYSVASPHGTAMPLVEPAGQ